MADINLTSVAGKGASFQTDGLVYQSIASGQTGVLVSLPEVEGKVYRITLLSTATASNQSGISLITNDQTIADQLSLIDSTPSTTSSSVFGVSSYSYTTTTAERGLYRVIECKSFSIEKNTGNTTENIDLTYEIGEYK